VVRAQSKPESVYKFASISRSLEINHKQQKPQLSQQSRTLQITDLYLYLSPQLHQHYHAFELLLRIHYPINHHGLFYREHQRWPPCRSHPTGTSSVSVRISAISNSFTVPPLVHCPLQHRFRLLSRTRPHTRRRRLIRASSLPPPRLHFRCHYNELW
jgi:hypothetical protein